MKRKYYKYTNAYMLYLEQTHFYRFHNPMIRHGSWKIFKRHYEDFVKGKYK